MVIHYHIFKNGGSTVESILEREFGLSFATLHASNVDDVLDNRDLAAFLEDYPSVAAITSHHLRYPKPAIGNAAVFDCCFFRDPLRRLQSLYSFYRRAETDDPLSLWARRFDSRQFMQRLVDQSPNQVSDVQVNFLANSGIFLRPPDEDDLDRAADTMRTMAIPGVLDMFDESLVSAEYYLKPAFPTIRLDYVPRNVSPAAPGRGFDLKEVWGPDLYETLSRMNRLDTEFIRRTRAEIVRRFENVPEAQRRLAEFRVRCARRVAATRFSTPIEIPAIAGLDSSYEREGALTV